MKESSKVFDIVVIAIISAIFICIITMCYICFVQKEYKEMIPFKFVLEETPILEVSEKTYSHPQYQRWLAEGDGGISLKGRTNCFWGRLETYYSSNVLYHYRTKEWTADSEGFYRTKDGYYVVAASDMPEGTIFFGSKGLCQVLDCGCSAGTTDYYVNW